MLAPLGIVVAVLLLWKGADWVVDSATAIAKRMGVSELVVGLTVVALGTSAPEIVVSLIAASQGKTDLSVANVVGSNICNTGLILGLCAALYCIPTTRSSVLRDVPILLVASCLLLLFLMDGALSRSEGLCLLATLFGYTAFLIHRARSGQGADEDCSAAWHASEEDAEEACRPNWQHGLLMFLGLIAVVGGAQVLVASATTVAERLGFSDWAIGVTVVAGGTSLPELATALVASRRDHSGLVIGNLIGSDLFNVLGVLGIASVSTPLFVEASALRGVAIMIGFILMLLMFMRSGWRLSRAEGMALVAMALWRWTRDVVPGMW